MAYLSTHMCLTHGQTMSDPIALAGLMAAPHSQLILTCMHPQSHSSPCHHLMTTSIGHPTCILVPTQHDHPTLWSNTHDTLQITSPEPIPYHPSQDAVFPA